MIIKYEPNKVNIKGYVRDDCTINAIGSAVGISYDLARKLLQTGIYNPKVGFSYYKNKPRTKAQFALRSNVLKICEAISSDKNIFISETERKEKLKSSRRNKGLGDDKNSVAKFAEANPEGVFILLTHGHLLTVINGDIIDGWDSSKMAVEIAYRINVEKAREVINELAKFYRMDNENHYVDSVSEIKKMKKILMEV